MVQGFLLAHFLVLGMVFDCSREDLLVQVVCLAQPSQFEVVRVDYVQEYDMPLFELLAEASAYFES